MIRSSRSFRVATARVTALTASCGNGSSERGAGGRLQVGIVGRSASTASGTQSHGTAITPLPSPLSKPSTYREIEVSLSVGQASTGP